MDKTKFMDYVAQSIQQVTRRSLPERLSAYDCLYQTVYDGKGNHQLNDGTRCIGISSSTGSFVWGIERVLVLQDPKKLDEQKSVNELILEAFTSQTIRGYVRIVDNICPDYLVGIVTTNFKTVSYMEGNGKISYSEGIVIPDMTHQALTKAIPELLKLHYEGREIYTKNQKAKQMLERAEFLKCNQS